MFSNLHLKIGLVAAAIVIVGAGLVPVAHAQSDVTLRVVSKEFRFEADTTLTVEVEIGGTIGLAGLDFVMSYPEELVPEAAEATGTGELWPTVVVNYDRNDDLYAPAEGRRLVSAAAANATNLADTEGLVVLLEFPVTCLGNAQNFPEGRDVTFEIVAVNASRLVPDQDGDGFEDLASVDVATEDGTINLNCTTVSGDVKSFGTLKSVFGHSTEVK